MGTDVPARGSATVSGRGTRLRSVNVNAGHRLLMLACFAVLALIVNCLIIFAESGLDMTVIGSWPQVVFASMAGFSASYVPTGGQAGQPTVLAATGLLFAVLVTFTSVVAAYLRSHGKSGPSALCPKCATLS